LRGAVIAAENLSTENENYTIIKILFGQETAYTYSELDGIRISVNLAKAVSNTALLQFHYFTWKVIYWLREKAKVKGQV